LYEYGKAPAVPTPASALEPIARHPLIAPSPWLEAVPLPGTHVALEPLGLEHAAELFTALDHEDVWRYIPGPRPSDEAEMAANIHGMLRSQALGQRVAWLYRDPSSGAAIGTSSFCPPEERQRSVHIGGTMTARAHWRTGVNTEAKLLLMTHAFETLGAVRVEWQTDHLNERSQAAIARLGAQREGVLRKHKQRNDGSWRDSVFFGLLDTEWPAAKERLLSRLAAHR
jgi:uncharacterized protein